MSRTEGPKGAKSQVRVDMTGRSGPGVMCQMVGLGDDLSDHGLIAWYKTFDNVPQWLQNKVNILQIMHSPPPAAKVAGIGEKVEEGVYWVEVSDE